MKKIIPPVKGTRDFYPEEMGIRTWLYQAMHKVSESFGYQEYEAPFLETLELYAAKSGEELVKEQAFVFYDRGGEQITLRPELTPSLARMVAQRQGLLTFPLRWWSFGPFWRYERPQKGRTREFFQWNVDLIGANSAGADAELIAMVARFFLEVGLKPDQVVIMVNNRKLMETEMEALGISSEQKGSVSGLIDRRSKMTPGEWHEYATSIGLSDDQFSGLIAVLDDPERWRRSEELVKVFEAISALGVRDFVRFDANVVRGLLYYTGTVFEAYDTTGEIRRAICGGGRYDNLLADVGGDPLPAVGFAMGDVVTRLLLQKLGLIPDTLNQTPFDALITVFDSTSMSASLAIATELRRQGFRIAVYPEAAKLGKQFKYADRMGIRRVIVAGPDELAAGLVTLKDLGSGEQVSVPRSELNLHLAS